MIRRPPRSTLFPTRRSSDLTTATGAAGSGLAPGADGHAWHTLTAERVLAAEEVAERAGLSSAEAASRAQRSEEHTSELQSRLHLVCRLLLEKKKKKHETAQQ